MKLKIVLLALFAAGAFAAIAIAKPPPKGSSTTTTGKNPGKVLVCHKLGNGKWVLLNVSTKSAHARLQHGDKLAVNRTCPGPIQGHGGTTTSATTTTTP